MHYKYNDKIKVYGTRHQIEQAVECLLKLELTMIEPRDRLIIQECLDNNKLKARILYDGNTVYPFEKTLNEFKKLKKDGSLAKLSKYLYQFLQHFDIAHYDIHGYRATYNNSYESLEYHVLKRNHHIPIWYADLKRIAVALNYFTDITQL